MTFATYKSGAIQKSASFEPSEYRRSIADMFGVLDAAAQRELIDRLALVPRHIHELASKGLIADRVVGHPVARQANAPRKAAANRG